MNLGKKGLLINDFDHSQFLKKLSHILIIYNENKNYFNDIILKYKKQNKKKETICNLIVKFEEYSKKTWDKFFSNNILNYNSLKKLQRCNS